MLCIVVRGANGYAAWARKPTSQASYVWICSRDGFIVAQPRKPQDAEQAIASIVQHSAAIVGATSLVFQVDV